MFINGQFVESKTDKWIDLHNPVSSTVLHVSYITLWLVNISSGHDNLVVANTTAILMTLYLSCQCIRICDVHTYIHSIILNTGVAN